MEPIEIENRATAAAWHDGMDSALYLANCAGRLAVASADEPDAGDALREIELCLRHVLESPRAYKVRDVAQLALLAVEIGRALAPAPEDVAELRNNGVAQ